MGAGDHGVTVHAAQQARIGDQLQPGEPVEEPQAVREDAEEPLGGDRSVQTSWPRTLTVPESGRSKPVTIDNVVVFAGAIGADEPEKGPLQDVQVQAADGDGLAEGPGPGPGTRWRSRRSARRPGGGRSARAPVGVVVAARCAGAVGAHGVEGRLGHASTPPRRVRRGRAPRRHRRCRWVKVESPSWRGEQAVVDRHDPGRCHAPDEADAVAYSCPRSVDRDGKQVDLAGLAVVRVAGVVQGGFAVRRNGCRRC